MLLYFWYAQTEVINEMTTLAIMMKQKINKKFLVNFQTTQTSLAFGEPQRSLFKYFIVFTLIQEFRPRLLAAQVVVLLNHS